MVIERDDGYDEDHIGEISGDMVIFYDDIEIVEHSSNISSTESDSVSSNSRSYPSARPNGKPLESFPPPPVPARTLKPMHLLSNQTPSPSLKQVEEPVVVPPTKVNRVYELEKAAIRKKIDVNSVNDILNRTEYFIGPTVTHRLPSARHFAGKLNSEDSSSRSSSAAAPNVIAKPSSSTMVKSKTLPLQPLVANGRSSNGALQSPTKSSFATLPIRSTSSVGPTDRHRSLIPDTNALVKQIQNSLSRNSLHDGQIEKPLSISTKDLRTFVSSTYSPSDENMIDDNGIVHRRHGQSTEEEQAFKRQARLSKSFHNVSEYNSTDQYPKKEANLASRAPPSKSVENDLNRVSQPPVAVRSSTRLLNFPPMVASSSFSALPPAEDNARMLVRRFCSPLRQGSRSRGSVPSMSDVLKYE